MAPPLPSYPKSFVKLKLEIHFATEYALNCFVGCPLAIDPKLFQSTAAAAAVGVASDSKIFVVQPHQWLYSNS